MEKSIQSQHIISKICKSVTKTSPITEHSMSSLSTEMLFNATNPVPPPASRRCTGRTRWTSWSWWCRAPPAWCTRPTATTRETCPTWRSAGSGTGQPRPCPGRPWTSPSTSLRWEAWEDVTLKNCFSCICVSVCFIFYSVKHSVASCLWNVLCAYIFLPDWRLHGL